MVVRRLLRSGPGKSVEGGEIETVPGFRPSFLFGRSRTANWVVDYERTTSGWQAYGTVLS
jgi:hypothetical protein